MTFKLFKVSYPSPEGEGLSAALSRSVSESEIYPGHFFIICLLYTSDAADE